MKHIFIAGLVLAAVGLFNAAPAYAYTIAGKNVYGYVGSQSVVGQVISLSDTPDRPVEVKRDVVGNNDVMNMYRRLLAEDQAKFLQFVARAGIRF